MNMSDIFARLRKLLLMLVTSITMVACVSTTTGGPETKPDLVEAAGINFQLAIEYFQNGNYELARDRLLLSTEQDPTKGVLRCHYNMMPFSSGGERVRPGTNRRSKEISMVTTKALLPVMELDDFPNAVVDVFI